MIIDEHKEPELIDADFLLKESFDKELEKLDSGLKKLIRTYYSEDVGFYICRPWNLNRWWGYNLRIQSNVDTNTIYINSSWDEKCYKFFKPVLEKLPIRFYVIYKKGIRSFLKS